MKSKEPSETDNHVTNDSELLSSTPHDTPDTDTMSQWQAVWFRKLPYQAFSYFLLSFFSVFFFEEFYEKEVRQLTVVKKIIKKLRQLVKSEELLYRLRPTESNLRLFLTWNIFDFLGEHRQTIWQIFTLPYDIYS